MAEIKVIPLFQDLSLSAGETGTSGIIDLRDKSERGTVTISHRNAAGTSTTCGTTVFTYMGCSILNGTYAVPTGVASMGTSGPAIAQSITPVASPALVPYMKVVATQTGAGTAGANSKITAELIVQ